MRYGQVRAGSALPTVLDTITSAGASLAQVTNVSIQWSPYMLARSITFAQRIAAHNAYATALLYADVRAPFQPAFCLKL